MKLRTVCAVSSLGNTQRWLPLCTSWNPGERQRETETNRKNERQTERRRQPRGGVSHSHRRILRSGEARPRETEREDASPGEKSATATDASSDLEKRGWEGRHREKTPAQGRSQPQPQAHPQTWRSMAEREMGRRRPLVQTMTAADTQRDEASSQEGQDTPSKNLEVIQT